MRDFTLAGLSAPELQQRQEQLAQLEMQRDPDAERLGEREALLGLRGGAVEADPREHVRRVEAADGDAYIERARSFKCPIGTTVFSPKLLCESYIVIGRGNSVQ